MSEMERFMDDHHIWSLWVTVDPLHVVEGHSVELMKWIVSKSSQHETQEMSHYLVDYCHSSFSPTARPGWKWRLVWASFPVTWDAVYPTDSLAHQLVLTWSLCCGFMYSSAENRNWKGWFKFLVLALKHFILCREAGLKMSLYLHQLFPHLVEQSWWLPCSSALTETTEHSWVTIKKIWPHCHSATLKNLAFLFYRWVSYQEYSVDWQRIEKVLSHVKRKCDEWRTSSPCKFSISSNNETIQLNSETELQTLVEYLKQKNLPEGLYSVKCNKTTNEIKFHVARLDRYQDSQVILPDFENTYQQGEKDRQAWKQKVHDLMTNHVSPSSLCVPFYVDPSTLESEEEVEDENEEENDENENKDSIDEYDDSFLFQPTFDREQQTVMGGSDTKSTGPFTDSSDEIETESGNASSQSSSEKSSSDNDNDSGWESQTNSNDTELVDLDTFEYQIKRTPDPLTFSMSFIQQNENVQQLQSTVKGTPLFSSLNCLFNSSYTDKDTILVHSFDILSASSFKRFFFPEYMNDEQMNIGLWWLSCAFHSEKVCILPSHWCRTQTPYSIPYSPSILEKSRLLLAPFNWVNDHWGVIGYDKKTRQGFFCESTGRFQVTNTAAQLQFLGLIPRFDKSFSRSLNFNRIPIPVQQDSWSCGLYTLFYIQKRSENVCQVINKKEWDVLKLRQSLLLFILEKYSEKLQS